MTQSYENYYTNEFEKTDIGLRACEVSDFRTKYQKSIFKLLSAGKVTSYCPKNSDKIKLYGNTNQELKRSYFSLSISKCT